MKKIFVDFLRDETGQDLVEYALITAAVGLALITVVNNLAAGVASLYSSITTDLASIGATRNKTVGKPITRRKSAVASH